MPFKLYTYLLGLSRTVTQFLFKLAEIEIPHQNFHHRLFSYHKLICTERHKALSIFNISVFSNLNNTEDV